VQFAIITSPMNLWFFQRTFYHILSLIRLLTNQKRKSISHIHLSWSSHLIYEILISVSTFSENWITPIDKSKKNKSSKTENSILDFNHSRENNIFLLNRMSEYLHIRQYLYNINSNSLIFFPTSIHQKKKIESKRLSWKNNELLGFI